MSVPRMVTIRITKRFRRSTANGPALRKLVRTVCKRFEVGQAVISIGIVDDAEISQLNRRFLGHEGTTDCLSFDLSDDVNSEAPRLFDLIVNGELAAREADCRGHGEEAELALYVTHGLLHNLGFDDTTDKQAREMHRMEDEILQHLGYGLVYNSGARQQ